ncbi:MAG: PKD domain-containing protein [Methanobacteriota archaeon]
MMLKKTITFILLSVLVCGFCSVFPFIDQTTAKTIYVDMGGGGNYTSIQAAVNAANPGDEIYVYAGTYYETLTISKNITLTGQNKNTTIIDGRKNNNVIRVPGSEGNPKQVSISGFTIQLAGGVGNDCIAMSYVRNSVIADNKILNSNDSSGIQLDNCDGITIHDNTISNNHQQGIDVIWCTNTIIHHNTLENNLQGIRLFSSSGTIVYRNTFNYSQNENAYDDGINSWSYNHEGNTWSDYDGSDGNGDGIGDTPYLIPGGSNQDLYPFGVFHASGNQKPTATIISISPISAIFGTTISFSGMGIGAPGRYIVGYNWTSSLNGNLSTQPSFSTSSLKVGTHYIYFSVQDNTSQWSTKIKRIITIDPTSGEYQKPIASISSINPPQATYGTMIYFNGYGVGQIRQYEWSSNLQGILNTHPYFSTQNLSIGTHTISFRVRDNTGAWSDPVNRTVLISSDSPDNAPPTAHANGPATGAINTPLTFNGSTSTDIDGTITTYRWEFGDDTTENRVIVTHTYTTTGNYTVTLIVTDNQGAIQTDTLHVTITQYQDTTNNNNTNNHDETPNNNGFTLPIPPTLTIPLIVIIVFICILAGFFYWVKHK